MDILNNVSVSDQTTSWDTTGNKRTSSSCSVLMPPDLVETDNLVLKFLLDSDDNEELTKSIHPKSTFALRMDHIRSRVGNSSCHFDAPDFLALVGIKYAAAFRIIDTLKKALESNHDYDNLSNTVKSQVRDLLDPIRLFDQFDRLSELSDPNVDNENVTPSIGSEKMNNDDALTRQISDMRD